MPILVLIFFFSELRQTLIFTSRLVLLDEHMYRIYLVNALATIAEFKVLKGSHYLRVVVIS